MTEDDVLASSSAGWKAVALPEPAKMISLPELAELPSAVEIERNDKAARAEAKAAAAAAKAEAKRAKSEAPVEDAPAVAATAADVPAKAAPVTPIGARIAAKPSGGKGKTIAIVGGLVAAAAAATIFIVTNKGSDTSHSASVTAETKKPKTEMAQLAPPPQVKVEPIEEPAPPPTAPPEQVAAVEPPADEKAVAKAETKKDKVHKVEIRDDRPAPKETAKVDKKDEPKAAKGGGDENEPSFDALLKEAGVSDQKKIDKPKLDKTDLSASDFKNGMNSVGGKAKGCYKGTQGTASFKVSISPSGSVASVHMKGQFAGTPEGSCIEAAVKGASFPAWDGPVKSFDYSYLLSD